MGWWCARTTRIAIMNSESRKKTAEHGETCSAKRTQTSRKLKAGNGKSQSKGTGRREEGMRNGDQEKESRFDRRTACEEAQWPNEPKLRANGRPGMGRGRGRKVEVQWTKRDGIAECCSPSLKLRWTNPPKPWRHLGDGGWRRRELNPRPVTCRAEFLRA